MRWASATNLSTTAGSCFVVGIQCRPRPLSLTGRGYAASGCAVDEDPVDGSMRGHVSGRDVIEGDVPLAPALPFVLGEVMLPRLVVASLPFGFAVSDVVGGSSDVCGLVSVLRGGV